MPRKTYTPDELKAVLDAHWKWLRGEEGGTRAVLTGADLTRADLRDAVLTGAVLTDAVLTDAVLTGAVLTGAVLTGAVLTDADLTDAVLTDADLTDAVLTGAVLTGAVLTGAVLTDADLTGAVLTGAVLTGAVLTGAVERYCKVPSLHRRIVAAIDAGGTLEMGNWHTCETTHCRAGWAIHLAGPAGAMLEACVGPVVAGALIHIASCPQLEGKVPNFYATNEEALAEIRRLAELEPALN